MTAQGEALGNEPKPNYQSPERATQDPAPSRISASSIPNIPLIKLHFVLRQERTELVLIRNSPMMLTLADNVPSQVTQLSLTNGERPVAILPRKIGVAVALQLEPFRGTGLDFLNEIADGHRSRQAASDVDVIVRGAD